MSKVYITGKIAQNGITLLRNKGFEVDINLGQKDLSSGELEEVFSKYNAVLTMLTNRVDASLISKSSDKLKIISNYAVGFDNIDIDAASKKHIAVCNTPGVASESVAEHTFALILALNKQIKAEDNFVQAGKYKQWDPGAFLSHQVWGQTIGIIGCGRIGTFVGQIAYGGFKMNVLYFDIRRAEDFELLCEARYAQVDDILKEADIITLHVPLDAKTRHLIGKRELKLMKNSAILINTARGAIVDEEALVWALKEGEIAACGLDVFEHEPAVAEELTKMENVILTPHVAAATVETREKMSEIAAQNIIDVFEGKEPAGLVKI